MSSVPLTTHKLPRTRVIVLWEISLHLYSAVDMSSVPLTTHKLSRTRVIVLWEISLHLYSAADMSSAPLITHKLPRTRVIGAFLVRMKCKETSAVEVRKSVWCLAMDVELAVPED